MQEGVEGNPCYGKEFLAFGEILGLPQKRVSNVLQMLLVHQDKVNVMIDGSYPIFHLDILWSEEESIDEGVVMIGSGIELRPFRA